MQPAPAPRFSLTPGEVQGPPPEIGAHNVSSLKDWGLDPGTVEELKKSGVI